MIAPTPDDCEWYTPPEILERVYRIMPIDLDPASSPQSTVLAKRYYTKQDDGLSQPWEGNIYLNPPYGREAAKWIDKLVTEYKANRTQQAILLIHAKTDTRWFNQLVDWTAAMVCIKGRLRFVSPEGVRKNAGTFPSLVFLLSTNHSTRMRFFNEFSEIGTVWQRVWFSEHMK